MQVTSVATIDSAVDFRFDHDDDLSELGGAASRFKFNVAAIALLKRLEAESRPLGDLTGEERHTLARYTGWGDSDILGRAFPNGTYSWSRPCAELQELLTPDEIKSLLASTLNAHFTSLPIIRAIYAALDHFGLAPHGGERVIVRQPCAICARLTARACGESPAVDRAELRSSASNQLPSWSPWPPAR
jgi:hypothetical protein